MQEELFDLQEKMQPQRFEQVLELIIEKCQEMIDSNDIFVDGDKDIFLNRFVEPYLKSNNSKTFEENTLPNSDIPDYSGYIKKYSIGLDNPSTLINKMFTYIKTHETVAWVQLKKVCVTEFGCTNEQSGSIGASLKTLLHLNKIRVSGNGGNKRISTNYNFSPNKENPAPIDGQIEVFHYFPKNKTKAGAIFELLSKKIIYNGEPNLSPSGAAIKMAKDNNSNNVKYKRLDIFVKYVDLLMEMKNN